MKTREVFYPRPQSAPFIQVSARNSIRGEIQTGAAAKD